MAASVAEILLRITPDTGDAKRELLALAKGVQQFDGEDASATADVDTEQGSRKLKDLFGEVARWAKERASAKIDADTRAATEGIDRVNAKADRLDAKKVDVEVDLDTKPLERALARLAAFGGRGGREFHGLATGIRDAYTAIVGLLIPGMISLVGTFAPLITVLASAALGLGALGIAAAGVMVPAVLLAAGVMSGFTAQSKIAGTAAFKLKQQFTEFGTAFRAALGPATNQLIRGVTVLLDAALAVVRRLRDEMTVFGAAVRGALGLMADRLRAATPMLERLTRGAAGAVGPLVRIFTNLGRIILNIAVAAMPLLVKGLSAAAVETGKWANSTSNIRAVRDVVRGFVRDLLSVAEFTRQVGRLLFGVFSALIGPGRQAATTLTDLVRQTADWTNSAKGQREIRRFFNSAFFAIRDLGNFIRTYGPAIGAFFVTFGKSTTLLMKALNTLPGGLVKVVGALAGFVAFGTVLGKVLGGTLVPVMRAFASAISFVGQRVLFAEAGVGLLEGVLGGLGAVLASPLVALAALGAAFVILRKTIGGAMADVDHLVIGAIRDAISGAASAATRLVAAVALGLRDGRDRVNAAGIAVMQGFRTGIASMAGAIRDTARSIGQRVVEIVRSFTDNARAAGTAVFTAVRNGIASVAGAIHAAARSILTATLGIVRGFVGNARAAGTAVFNAVRNGIASVAGAIHAAARSILSTAIGIVRGFADNARGAGEAVFNAVRNGIASVAGEIRSAARSAVEGGVSAVLSLAGSFFNAGKALVQALANGILAGANAAIGALKGVANTLRGLLPHSEPDDPTSPLRRLGDSGKALVANFAKGISQAAPALNRVLADALGGISAQMSVAGAVPAAAVGLPDLLQPSSSETNWNFNLRPPSGYGPQSDAFESYARLAQIVRDRGGLAA